MSLDSFIEDIEIPEFIKLRGCINCDASKLHKKRHGTDYGFDHEIVARCLLIGCVEYGHGVYHPFIDAEEILRMFEERREILSPKEIKNVRTYLLKVKEVFGKFYEEINVSLDELIFRFDSMFE